MKKLLAAVSLTFLSATTTLIQAQDWQSLGGKIISNNGSRMTFTVSKNGTVYVAYSNAMNAGLLNVCQFDGQEWKYVGKADFSQGPANAIALSADNNGTLYVAYRDMKRQEKALVQKFDGTEWVLVGKAEVSQGMVNSISLQFDKSNTPWLALADQKRGRLSVYKLANDTWTELASPEEHTPGDFVTLAFDHTDIPYICFSNTAMGGKATVKKWVAGNWLQVGKTTASDKEAKYTSFALDSKGTPYVAYQDAFFNNKVMARKFDGANWVNMGDPVFSLSSNDNVSLAVEPSSGTPYVAFHNKSNFGDKADVKKIVSGKWVDAGNAAGEGSGAFNTLLFQNSALYICFNESGNGATVKKLAAGK